MPVERWEMLVERWELDAGGDAGGKEVSTLLKCKMSSFTLNVVIKLIIEMLFYLDFSLGKYSSET